MAKLTKKQFEEMFREEVLPYLEQDDIPDKPARREAWNNTVDAYIRDRSLPESAGNWSHPRWLETYRPRGTSHATKKGTSKSVKTYTVHGHFERQSRSGGVMKETYSHWTRTGLSKSAADQLAREQRAEGGVARVVPENDNANGNGSSRRHATKRSPSQLDAEIAESLQATSGKRSHATRKGGSKEVTYRGYTYNLRNAYDRGYYDALRGVRAQEQSSDYSTGYSEGQRAPYLRR